MRVAGDRRSRLLWAGALVAVVLVVAGVLIAYLGYRETSGPDGVVRGYFAALTRGDAPAALAYGDVPSGSRELLTAAALAEQRRIAPIKQVKIGAITRNGTRGGVAVRYMLDFPGEPQQVDTTVAVREQGGDWRLARSAIATQLSLSRAQQRASVLGTAVSEGTVLLFPGAVPVRFDTSYLQLSPAQAAVDFGAGPTTDVGVTVSDAGRRRAESLVAAAFLGCLSGRGDRSCPLPSDRYVPGSLRGALVATPPNLTVTVGDQPTGVLEVAGDVAVVGTYRRLNFENRPSTGKGRVVVPVLASSFALAPLAFSWTRP